MRRNRLVMTSLLTIVFLMAGLPSPASADESAVEIANITASPVAASCDAAIAAIKTDGGNANKTQGIGIEWNAEVLSALDAPVVWEV